MSSILPVTYYENQENHGSYAYVTLEEVVNNFMQNYTGDNTVLGNVKRYNVLYWARQGMRQFSMDALKEVKAVELELGSTLDIILPPDYVSYVRISWVHPQTGDLMPLSKNTKLPLATAYLQDNNAEILFDNDGYPLEGTSNFQLLKDEQRNAENVINVLNCGVSCSGCQYEHGGCLNTALYRVDTSRNANGYFNIDTRQGRIHFSSDNASRVLMLEYISDGLEYTEESDIKINKMAEYSLNAWINWNLLNNRLGIQEYIIRRAKKDYDTAFRNTKIKLMDLRPHELIHTINKSNQWFK